MRSFVVTALAAAIVACLALSVSAGGYGHGGHQRQYYAYQPPRYATRYYKQHYVIPGSGGAGGGVYGYGAGAQGLYGGYSRGLYGANYGYGGGAGGLIGGAIGTGINLVWYLVIFAIILFVLGSL